MNCHQSMVGGQEEHAIWNKGLLGMKTIESFEDLNVWKTCRELRRSFFDLTMSFPSEEKFRLTDQIRRAAIIAEGYGWYHYQEDIQFCRQFRGSL